MFETTTLPSSTGAQLRLYSTLADGEAKAAIQVNHGMAEHAARYQRFGEFLNAKGYHLYAHDHRGHGATTSPDAPLGTFAKEDGWQKVLTDTNTVNTHIANTHPDLPIVCFGHSMGAAIALAYAEEYPDTIAALACWNGADTGFLPGLLKNLLKIECMLKGSDVPSLLANKLSFEAFNKAFKPNRTGFDWLSRDEAEVDKYVADPLCGFPVNIGLWSDFPGGLNETVSPANLARLPRTLPIHLLAGQADPCSNNAKAAGKLASVLRANSMNNVQLVQLENTRHESLNEVNRDETMQGFVDWLDGVFV